MAVNGLLKMQASTIVMALALTLMTLASVDAADLTYTPQTLTDSVGNTADENNNVDWAPVPAGTPYKGESDTLADGGLEPYFNMVNTFLDVLVMNEPPYDVVADLANGNSDSDKLKEVITFAVGLMACVAVGILFILIMPIVACCVCCCRTCCNNCGGKKIQKNPSGGCCCCMTLGLIAVTISLAGSVVCLYLVNEQLTSTVDNMETSITDNLDDVNLFLENTADDVEFVALDGFKFTASMVSRDMENLGYLIGMPVRDKLDTDAGVTAVIDDINAIDTVVDNTEARYVAVDADTTSLQADQATLESDLSAVVSDINTATGLASCSPSGTCSSYDTSGIVMEVDYDNLPDITSNIAGLQAVQTADLAATVNEGKETFDDLPEQIANDTRTISDDVTASMNTYTGTVEDLLEEILRLPDDIEEPISDLKDDLTSQSENIDTYNKYRWYAGLGLACIPALLVVLQILGILIGGSMYSSSTPPTERGCMSNCAGNMLMAAAGLSFIFSILLMVLTTLTFLPGSMMDKIICEPLMDPEYAAFNELIDEPGGIFGDDYFFGRLLLSDGSIPLKVSGVLEDCKENAAAYPTLKMENVFNLAEMIDYEDDIDISGKLAAINVDFSGVQILSSDAETLLNSVKTHIHIDYNGFQTELANDVTVDDLSVKATELRALADTSTSPADTQLDAAADELDRIQSALVTPMATTHAELLTEINSLESDLSTVSTDIDTIITDANSAETYIHTNGDSVITDIAADLETRLISTIDSFMNKTEYQLDNDVAKCTPIWTIWKSLVHNAICLDFVNTLNGFWFALGWAVFFMIPGIILNMKLAKYFRTMKYAYGMDHPNAHGKGMNVEGQAPRYPHSNKVGNHEPFKGSPPPSYAVTDPTAKF